MQDILNKLRNHKNNELEKERENLRKLDQLFKKLPERYLRKPFDDIILNYPV